VPHDDDGGLAAAQHGKNQERKVLPPFNATKRELYYRRVYTTQRYVLCNVARTCLFLEKKRNKQHDVCCVLCCLNMKLIFFESLGFFKQKAKERKKEADTRNPFNAHFLSFFVIN